MRSIQMLAAAAAAFLSAPALAQDADAPLPDPDTAGNGWTVALGVGYVPDYVGSNDYRIIPAGALRGSIGRVAISTQSTYLYADFFPRGKGVDLDVGPIVGVRLNRTGHIHDRVVKLLPDRKAAIEAGGFVGISLHDLTNPYDTLQLRFDVVHDFANAHESTTFSPNLSFSTPLSRKTFVSASLSAEFVSNKFADYYFSVSPAESALTLGVLPAFNADGGAKNWNVSLLANHSLTGDLTGGLSIFGLANYSRLLGDFKRTPIVSDRGSASQWMVAAGLAYTF